jgi:hypothetical protein
VSRRERLAWFLSGAGIEYFAAHAAVGHAWPLYVAFVALGAFAWSRAFRDHRHSPAPDEAAR